jgi:hypothetical protein
LFCSGESVIQLAQDKREGFGAADLLHRRAPMPCRHLTAFFETLE